VLRSKNKKADINIVIFAINVAFVIVGYGINVATDKAYLEPVKLFRTLTISIGLTLLLVKFYKNPKLRSVSIHQYLILVYFLFFSSMLCTNIAYSLSRSITFVFPFLYIIIFIAYLISKFNFKKIWKINLEILNWSYLILVIAFALFDFSLSTTNLYGRTEIFVSNHYGWSSVIFILSSIDLLSNYKLAVWRKLLLIIFILLAVFILFTSGSRSSWLSLATCSLFFLFRNKSINVIIKGFSVLIIFFFLNQLLNQKNSSINKRIAKTQRQLSNTESMENDRLGWANNTIKYLNKNPILWITGIGLFNYEEFDFTGYHNSYLEVLFGCGYIVFAYFFYLFVLKPLYYFLNYYSKYFLVLPPLVIIPFFESNLTGGQFLFFPWFLFTILFSIPPNSFIQKSK